MTTLSRIALIAAVALACTQGSMAAEPISYDTSGNVSLAVYDQPAFDWNGFYAGVYAVTQLGGADDEQGVGLGINAGVNAQFDFYLLGAEVAVQGLTSTEGSTEAQLVGRAGLVVTDDVVAYAAAGYGLDVQDTADNEFLVGGGLEVAVTDSLSLRGQYLFGIPQDDSVSGNSQVTFGAAFHF